MKKALKILITVSIITGCCSPPIEKDNFEFSKSEEDFLSPFVINDTIFYENNEFDIDTILIRGINKESYNECSHFIQRAPSNWRSVEIIHLPVDNWTGTSQNQGEAPRITYQQLFSMGKDFERNSIEFSITFRGFHSKYFRVGIDTTKKLSIGRKTLHNCYKLEHMYPERISELEDIVHVYWTKKDGMVAYENKAGKIWIKKNL